MKPLQFLTSSSAIATVLATAALSFGLASSPASATSETIGERVLSMSAPEKCHTVDIIECFVI